MKGDNSTVWMLNTQVFTTMKPNSSAVTYFKTPAILGEGEIEKRSSLEKVSGYNVLERGP